MTTYESEIKTISANDGVVFAKLSDLSHLGNLQDKIPAQAGVSDLHSDADSVSFKVKPIGEISLRIVTREPNKTIKLEADNSPVPLTIWIQLVGKEENLSKLKLTIKTELPMMVKMMLGSKLQGFINQFADMLAKIDY